jgi:hypothetical protein
MKWLVVANLPGGRPSGPSPREHGRPLDVRRATRAERKTSGSRRLPAGHGPVAADIQAGHLVKGAHDCSGYHLGRLAWLSLAKPVRKIRAAATRSAPR